MGPGKAPDDPKGAMQSKGQRTSLAQVILPLKVTVESRWARKKMAKERLVFSWAYRNEMEVLLSTSFPSIFAKLHLPSTCTQP